MTDSRNTNGKEPRLDRLKMEVDDLISNGEKRLKRSLIIKGIIALVIAGYLGVLAVYVKDIDPDAVMYGVRGTLEQSIPDIKKRMTTHLAAQAPMIIDQAGAQLLVNMPNFGESAESAAKTALTGISDPIEKDLTNWMTLYIREKKAFLDEIYPGRSSYEKITELRRMVLEESKVAVEGASYTVAENLKDHPFTMELHRLVYAKDLSKKEKLQRDVLAIWYVLVQKKLDELGRSLDNQGYPTD